MNDKHYIFECPDRSLWAVPVGVILKSAEEYGQSIGDDGYTQLWTYGDIMDWAVGDMNWEDVKDHAKMVRPPQPEPVDFQEAWSAPEHCMIRELQPHEIAEITAQAQHADASYVCEKCGTHHLDKRDALYCCVMRCIAA